jgi:hypothetical protein
MGRMHAVRVTVRGLEKAPEAWQDFILDVAQRAADKIGRAEHPAPRSRRWFIEGYLKGDIGIELILARKDEPAYFRAVLIGTRIEADGSALAEPGEVLDAYNGSEQFMVLIPDVEFVEDGKFVVRWLRSLVRLYLIKEPSHLLGNAGRNIRKCWPRVDGELGIPVRGLLGRDNKLPGEMVEGDAEIMDRVADDRATYRLDDRYPAEPYDIFRTLLIALSDDGLLAHRINQSGTAVKILKMGFCPVDLGVDTF